MEPSLRLNRPSAILFILIVAVLDACTGGVDDRSGAVHRSSVGDTLYVVNTPPSDPQPQAFVLVADLTIGVAEGDDEYMLVGVESVAVDSDGRIVVGSQWDRDVRVFGPDGGFLFRVGGPGQGPGEFSSNYFGLYEIRAWPDLITVQDLPRLNLYDGDGGFLRSLDSGLLTSRVRRPGSALGSQFWLREPGSLAGVWRQFTAEGPTILYLFTADESLESIRWLGRVEEPTGFHRIGTGGGFSIPFTPDLHVTLTGQSILVWGLSEEYRLLRYDAAADNWTVFSLETAPRPVTSAEIAAFKQRFLDREQTSDWGPYLDDADYPDNHPFFNGLVGDDEGRVWVEVSAPDEEAGRSGYRYHLFDPAGVYLGVVDSPAEILAVGSSHAYTHGAEEHPTVVRHRLIRPER